MGAVISETVVGHRQTLRTFAALAPDPTRITRRTILRWRDSMRHLAPSTQRTRYSTVHGFCTWLVKKGVVRRDPCVDIPAPKVPRPTVRILTPDQADALVAACEDTTDLLILALGFDAGLRRSEMAGLEMGDLVLGPTPTMTVTGKGGHRRTLPIPAATYTVLTRYVSAHGHTAGPLIRLRKFPERGVQPVWVGRRFTELAYRAGVKVGPRDGVSHHAMRRSLATKLYALTGDVQLVADVLGHCDLSQLKHYVRSGDCERMRAALNGQH